MNQFRKINHRPSRCQFMSPNRKSETAVEPREERVEEDTPATSRASRSCAWKCVGSIMCVRRTRTVHSSGTRLTKRHAGPPSASPVSDASSRACSSCRYLPHSKRACRAHTPNDRRRGHRANLPATSCLCSSYVWILLTNVYVIKNFPISTSSYM